MIDPGVPPLAIGSSTWPGVAKLIEECGELQQVLGKLGAYPDGEHPDGSNLVGRLHDELADVLAAIDFVAVVNDLDGEAIMNRLLVKRERFQGWHEAERS